MILFVIALLLAIFTSAEFLLEMHNHCAESKKLQRWERLLKIIARCVAGVLLVAGLLDAFRLLDFGVYRGVYVFFALACLGEYFLVYCQKRHTSAVVGFAAKCILAILILEPTVCNLPSYHLWFGNYTETQLNMENALLEGNGTRNADGSITISGEEEMVLTFENLKQEIGTIHPDVTFEKTGKEALLKIDVADETQSKNYRYDIIKQKLVQKREKSQYTACEFSGEVDRLRVKITPISGKTVTLHNVTVNQTIPMDISWIRVGLLLFLAVFVYAVMKSERLHKSYAENRKFCRNAAALITAVFCFLVIFSIDYELGDRTWKDQLHLESGNQMTQELVDAFEAGQVHLLAEPSDELNAMENPYDRNARDQEGGSVLWDHVYFNNHYYSYYGIAPVVLIYLPYHRLTGYYFPDTLGVMLFAIVGIIGLTMVYLTFLKKWFSKTPSGILLACLILLHIVSGIWFSVGRPDFYEAAISAGFACLTWGTFFLMRANVLGGGKISFWKTTLAALLLALAVLCRPTLAVYCICAVVFFLMAIPRVRAGNGIVKNGSSAKQTTLYLVGAAVPILCLAGVQMWYNYARFGSPMDFGIQYSLTINDFTRSQFHFRFVLMALYNYLFNTPVFTAAYPFIHSEFQDMEAGGFFYADVPATGNTSGLLFLSLPIFAYLFSGVALKQLPQRRDKVRCAAYIGLPCVIMPLVIIASVWESGYAVRYMLDFSWQMTLGALAIIFFLYQKLEQELAKKFLKGLICFAMVWAVIVGGVQVVNQMFRYVEYHYDCPEIAYDLTQLFAFWK